MVYDGAGLGGAPRVWWTFRVFGARNVFILDGGLPKWKAEGRPLEAGEGKRAPRSFDAALDTSRGRRRRRRAARAGRIAPPRWSTRGRPTASAAKPPEPRPGVRSGHMPGALNVPVTELIADGRLVAPEKIAERFKAGGVDLDKPIITSCGSGVTAATLWFALDAIGKAPEGALRRLLDRMGRAQRPADRARSQALTAGTSAILLRRERRTCSAPPAARPPARARMNSAVSAGDIGRGIRLPNVWQDRCLSSGDGEHVVEVRIDLLHDAVRRTGG